MEKIDTYLADLEERLLPDQEERVLEEWRCFARGQWGQEFFRPRRQQVRKPQIDWPEVNINDAIEDDELMLVDQFGRCSIMLEQGSGGLFTVRSNYGVGILPSVFGAPAFVMPREMNTLPNVKAMPGGRDDIRRILETGSPDLKAGYGERVFRIGERYQQIFSRYPRIARYIRTDHPDTQGPMDVCELLYGSAIFLDLYDNPDLIHALLRRVTDTYKAFLEAWFVLSPPPDELHSYFGNGHLGRICVRDDSAMNLSPEMFEEFVFPYDQEVLNHFGGGAIHFCGRGDHFVPFFHGMAGLRAVNLSQPEYNDMEIIYHATIDRGIPLIGLREDAIEDAVSRGRSLRGLVSAA